jgi:hypothetical protein
MKAKNSRTLHLVLLPGAFTLPSCSQSYEFAAADLHHPLSPVAPLLSRSKTLSIAAIAAEATTTDGKKAAKSSVKYPEKLFKKTELDSKKTIDVSCVAAPWPYLEGLPRPVSQAHQQQALLAFGDRCLILCVHLCWQTNVLVHAGPCLSSIWCLSCEYIQGIGLPPAYAPVTWLMCPMAAALLQVTFTPLIDGSAAKPQQAMLMLAPANGPAAYAVAKVKKDGSHVISLTMAMVHKQVGKQVGGHVVWASLRCRYTAAAAAARRRLAA